MVEAISGGKPRFYERASSLGTGSVASTPATPGRISTRPIDRLADDGARHTSAEATRHSGTPRIDDKVLCVPLHDPEWDATRELDDVSPLLREEIAHFFSIYKDLELDRHHGARGWADHAEAEREIEDARLASTIAPPLTRNPSLLAAGSEV